MARNLNVKIVGDASSYQRALRSAQKDTSHLQKGFHALGVAAKVGLGAGLLAVGLAAKASTKELIQQQQVMAQTGAVLKSTGNAANVTKKHVTDLSNSLLRKTGIDDEVIQSGENMLLTFRNIRNEAGKNNDIFDQATVAGLDMSKAMEGAGFEGGNLKTTMIRLGKALNDPVTGMTALRRVGITFSKDQQDLIKHLEATGHHLEAQKLILKELKAEFGGSAEAAGKTLPGQLMILREALKNIGAEVVAKLVPSLTRLSTWLVGVGLPAVEKFVRGIDFGAIVESLRAPLQSLVAGLKGVGNAARDVRNFLGPNLFLGLVVGILGAAGALKAVIALRTEMKALAALGAGGGPVAVAFLGLAVTIGALATVFLHNRAAANKVSDAYREWANSARDLKSAEDSLKQAQLDVEQSRLRQQQTTLAVTDAQKAYNQAVREFGPASQQAHAALLNLHQAKLDNRQADIDAKKATEEKTKAEQSHRDAVVNTTKAITDAAGATRRHQNSVGALAGALDRLTHGVLHDQTSEYETGAEKAEQFAKKADKIAASQRKLNPRLAAGAAAMADLARAIQSVPSDLTIRFIVKTLSFTPGNSPQGGPFQGGGHAAGGRIPGARQMADSVPAMLSPGEFVVTGGGERMLESMTFPGVLNWLGTKQPRHFAMGGRAGRMTKQIEYDRLYQSPLGGTGGAVSGKGLVPQVLRALAFARGHGWGGSVISGFRTYAQQLAIWNSGVRPAARPGTSSHERGQAVDVSDASSFDTLMNQAPLGSQLFNLVPGDFNHFSVSGYAAGGRVAGPGGSVSRPDLPTPAPTPLAGLRKRIRALRAEERQLKSKIATVDAQIRQIDKTKKKSKAQIARRKDLAAESGRLHARLKSVQAQLVSLNQRVQEVVQHDYSELPISLQLEAAQAALTETTADDATALAHAQAYLESQLRRPGITKAQRVQLLRALAGVRGDLANLGGDTGGGGGGGDTGAAPVDTADLEAQLAQANARATYSAESARLANAFVSTGVFGSSTPGVAGAGNTIIFNNLIPDADQIRRATEAIAGGAGDQAYRGTSVFATGY